MDTAEWREKFKLLLPVQNVEPEMLEVTKRVLKQCVAFAKEYGMEPECVHMWDAKILPWDTHYIKFRIVVEFALCTMWLDTAVFDDAGTSRKAVSTYATIRDENNKTMWHGYVFNEGCLRSVFARYTKL